MTEAIPEPRARCNVVGQDRPAVVTSLTSAQIAGVCPLAAG
jgi:hypothetical protein